MTTSNDLEPAGAQAARDRYWQALAVYLFGTVVGIIAIPYLNGHTPAVLSGAITVIILFVLVIASIGALCALFFDSAELDTVNARWEPTWWIYVGATVLTTILAYHGTKLLFDPNAAVVVAVPTLVASAFLACATYLYQRHENLGVP